MSYTVRDNPAENRYEMDVDGGVAVANYRADDKVVTVFHTEVPAALRGRGLGDHLVKGTLDLIRESGRKVSPRCGFVATYIRRHRDYQDLLA
jgi:predicted GNAT family acetyltransferase